MRNKVLLRAVVTVVALATMLTMPASGQVKTPSMYIVPPTRNPLGQPFLGPEGWPREDMMVPAPPLSPEDQVYADLDGVRMKRWVEEIANISRKDRDMGTVYWGRNFGTPGHAMAEDWTEAHFKRLGMVDIHRDVVGSPRPMWTPKSYEINFATGGMTFKLPSARPSQSTSAEIDAELVWVGEGTAADFLDRDVKGKAVLIQDIPLPGDINHTANREGAIKRAYDNGAAAVGLVFGVADNLALWQSTDGKPGFNLGFRDAARLREMLGKGQSVRLKYKLDAEFKSDLKSASVLGTLPGTTDEKIIIVAHIDGYFESALDNASGMAMMMEMAEHYAKIPQAQRRRSIVFVGSVGHHGGPGTRNLHEKMDWPKVAYVINLEHVAVNRTELWGRSMRMSTGPAPLRWTMNASPAAFKVMAEGLKRFNVPVDAEIDGVVGEISAILQDAPSLTLITSPEVKHTEQDTPEWVPAAGLISVARAHSWILDNINKMDRKDIIFPTWPPAPAGAAGPVGD